MNILDNLIKINDVDCFRFLDYYTEPFSTLDKCIEICNEKKLNVFVICQNVVYFRNKSIRECVMNIVYLKNTDMFIYSDDNYLILKSLNNINRVNLYTIVLNDDDNIKYTFDKYNTFDIPRLINKIVEYIKSDYTTKWVFQHHCNMLKYIRDEELTFNLNPYDLNVGCDEPTFAKSRPIHDPKKTVLLPLEKLYYPNHFLDMINNDILFENKRKSCVWRGHSSGHCFDKNRNNLFASRLELVEKYYDDEKYNIGFSFVDQLTKEEEVERNMKPKIKGNISIKDQLEYMFIISVEGNDFATNLSWIMLSNSVPLMPKPMIETWKLESNLIEYVHYVPLKNDFSDLDSQMEWCLNNIDKCKEISFMSKLYVLHFFDNMKESDIIKQVISVYKTKTN